MTLFLRNRLLNLVLNDTPNVVAFQKLCGIQTIQKDNQIIITRKNPFLHLLFTFGAALGNELFYILFLPFLFWSVDAYLARRVILLWVFMYYVGQAVKDIFRLPRPPSPPTAKLEIHYDTEYGLPSTHVMSAITLPFYVLFISQQRLDYNFYVGLVVAFSWFLVVTCSRLYMGVHSIPDIIAGAILGFCCLMICVLFGHEIDLWMMTSKYVPVVTISVALLLVAIYPAPEKWTNAYGDTTIVVGVATGVVIAVWTIVSFGKYYLFADFDKLNWFNFKTIGKCLIGYGILFLTRSIIKKIGFEILVRILPKSDTDPSKRYAVEIPTKFVTYAAIGFNAVFTCPFIHHTLGLN